MSYKFPIFNIEKLTPFEEDIRDIDIGQIADVENIKELPLKEPPKIEKILDTKVVKKTKGKEYKWYLFKT